MKIDDLKDLEDAFSIRNGAWTRRAVEYVGLSFPLKAGWKVELLSEGSKKGSPHDNGLTPQDWLFLSGDTPEFSYRRYVAPDVEMKYRIDALESFASHIRMVADAVRLEARKMREEMRGEDVW